MATAPTSGYAVMGTTQTAYMTLADYYAFNAVGNPIKAGAVIIDSTTTPPTVLGISDGAGGFAGLLNSQQSAAATTGYTSTVASPLGMRAGILIAGDSLGAQVWSEQSPLTVIGHVGGLASVQNSNIAPVVGNRIKIGNVTSDPRWNGFWTVEAASGTTAQFHVDPTLDPNPSTTRTQMTVSVAVARTQSADYPWAESINGLNYTFVDNVAIGGRELSHMVIDFPLLEGKYRNCLIDFNGGTNDPKNGITAAVSLAAMEQYIVLAIAQGHKVLINTVPFLGAAANTAAIRLKTLELNEGFKSLALKYSMPLYDKFAAMVNPATSDSLAANLDITDSIHLTPTGARINGKNKAAIYAAFVPTRPINLPATTQDTIGINSTSTNIMDGFFAGTGGTGGAGSVATGWTLTPTTITVTGSKGVGTVGATQILTLSGASGSWTFNGTNVAANAVVGGVYEFVGKVSLANFAAPLRMTVQVALTVGGYNGGAVRAISTRNANAGLPSANDTIIFRSEPFTIPPGTISAVTPQLTGVTTAVPGGTETVTLEDWGIIRLS